MICPKCEYEFVEGITKCSDCGSDLIHTEDFEGNLVHADDWVILKTFAEQYEADMLKANLEGAEIETLVLGQKDRSYPTVGDLAIIKILVRKESAEDAVKILDDIYNNEN
ncbi:MAG: hypothetical protein SCALA702_06620 [Melioribacteraceae bacterium]|nr:MAG: hypothetical protein SCALA702_06620 [Melioribacteraceae bacterium]